jgi:hypothetical protein
VSAPGSTGRRGRDMTASDTPNSATERKRAERLDVARTAYHALALQDANRVITLCDKPAATAVGPNKMSSTPDTTVEPDKPPAVELNEVQPATVAAEPNKISPAPAPTVEPDKVPAELPAAAVEQNEALPRTSAGAVLRGSDIPD